uniref:placenta growth factor isoform X2 n=1 Tax=Panthera onca TaxID=9690 RepID=UPI0029540B3E|nr:placenta growth factor isoform X2 [Panthera onca]
MPAMRLFTCFLQLLAGLALPAVPPQQWALSAGNGSSEVEVVPFQEVWGRSYCRALERLVDIVSEYPSEVQHMFSPSCISLLRCTGCCGDENLHCVPVETVNVTMQLLKIHSEDRPSYVELTFSQHVRCECRPLREKMKPERRRPKGRGKRKREKQRPRDCHLCGRSAQTRLCEGHARARWASPEQETEWDLPPVLTLDRVDQQRWLWEPLAPAGAEEPVLSPGPRLEGKARRGWRGPSASSSSSSGQQLRTLEIRRVQPQRTMLAWGPLPLLAP